MYPFGIYPLAVTYISLNLWEMSEGRKMNRPTENRAYDYTNVHSSLFVNAPNWEQLKYLSSEYTNKL